jgi:hypothetical protein
VAGWLLKGNYRKYNQGPFNNPVARRSNLHDAIVIYPEIVSGNPLRASKVVRWLLHRPGFHTGSFEHGPNDLFFVYHEHFADPRIAADQTHRLTVTWANPVYRERGGTERSGTCYLLRKGKGRPLLHDPDGSTLLDGMSHDEMAGAFNRTTRLYSYDPYTLYNVYAALCGCIPIVVPTPGMTKEAWLPRAEDRFGLAYGEEEIPWAIRTRDALLARFRRVEQEESEMLHSFIKRCSAMFREGDFA